MSTLESLVSTLYSELTAASDTYAEAFDPDVHEVIAEVLACCFVYGDVPDEYPSHFGIRGREANHELAEILERFLEDAVPVAEGLDLAPGEARFAVLQDSELRTEAPDELWWPTADDELEEHQPLAAARFEVPDSEVDDDEDEAESRRHDDEDDDDSGDDDSD